MSQPLAAPKAGPFIDDGTITEVIGGEVITSPRPAPLHANAATGLASGVRGPFQHGRGGPGGWWILVEPELRLGGDTLVPDLAGWRRERLPVLPETAFFAVAPDWVCEVLSPATEATDRARKMPAYARQGVTHVWLIDPVARTLEVFRRDEKGWYLVGVFLGDDPVRAEPFAEIELDLSLLWA